MMLALLVTASTASAATDKEVAGLTPKNIFYFVDQFSEWLDLSLTFNKVRKVEKKLNYASERLAEMHVLEADNTLNQNRADTIATKFEKLSNEATDDVDTLKSGGQDVAELVRKLEELSSEHTAKLEDVRSRVPEEARDAIEHALEVSKRGHERAIEALNHELDEGNIDESEVGEEAHFRIQESQEKRVGAKVGDIEIDTDLQDINDMLQEIESSGDDSMEQELDNL